MLMKKMSKMISNEEICKPFFNFFHQKNYDNDLVNFESKCQGFTLDKYSRKKLHITELTLSNQVSENINEIVSQAIVDNAEIRGEEYQVKHSFVDWRQTLLQKKLEKIQSQQLMEYRVDMELMSDT